MRLILTLSGAGAAGPDTMRTLSSGSLSIGRGAGNDWVLADPQQNLSRTHCTITADGNRFVLTDRSSNGMFINGAAQGTERDSRVNLADGDKVRLGDYQLSVALVDDGPGLGPAPTQTANQAPRGGFASQASPSFGGHGGGPLDFDPLDDPAAAPAPAFHHPIAPPPPKNLRAQDPFDSRPAARAGAGDPFGGSGSGGFAPESGPLSDDDDLFRGITAPMDWTGATRGDHAPATAMAMPQARVTQIINPADINFDDLIGDLHPHGAAPPATPPATPAAPPAAPAQRNPANFDPFAEPEPQRAPPVLAPALTQPTLVTAPVPLSPSPIVAVAPQAPAPAPAPAPSGPDARALFAAFLEGAGVAGQRIDDSDPQAALRVAGQLFRVMTEGVREVLISRASIKSEMRIEQTMIASHGNNALKFSVTADDAVTALLTPKRPGYMPPLAAAKEAFDDIKSHEIAVMAGVQTALLALLKRFDPDVLEKRLTTSGLASVLPAARKARYWDAFRLTYGDISREAEDDFQSVFGRSFAKAYTAQTRKD